jgi:hypothetical protein
MRVLQSNKAHADKERDDGIKIVKYSESNEDVRIGQIKRLLSVEEMNGKICCNE